MSYDRTTCRLCGSEVKTKLTLKPTPVANSFPENPNEGEFYPLELKQCVECKHVQVGHVVEDSVLYGKHYKYSTPGALKPYLDDRARTLRKQYPDYQSVLEIGANNGLFLHSVRDAGFSPVIGIDPSSKDPLVWNLPFNVESASLIVQKLGAPDLILANNVFAHIDNLDQVFRCISSILSLDGTVIFEVQYFGSMVNTGVFDMIYHEHRDYHTLGPLARFLKKHGLVMTKYDLFPLHGGSIRVYAKRHGTECTLPGEPINWGKFGSLIGKAKKDVEEELNGKKVIGFGATAKACTLIHNFGIQKSIDYVVDNTKEKQGRYIPGTKIKILPEEELMNDHRPLFLTAWNYADYIRKKYPGREIIVPFQKRERKAA